MLFTHLTQAMTALVDVLAQNQRRLVEAQFDVCRQWVEACRPAQLNASATPLANAAEDTRLDGPMQATQSLLIAQVQAGNDLMYIPSAPGSGEVEFFSRDCGHLSAKPVGPSVGGFLGSRLEDERVPTIKDDIYD